jgi:RNA polymerase sigma-70 factor (ECF subfamily)
MSASVPGKNGAAPTSLTLLEKARARDRSAWERLADLYDPLVLNWCRRAGLPPTDAADVRQEVFLAVAEGLGAFERRREGSFRAWVQAITHTKVADHRRQFSPGRVVAVEAHRLLAPATVPDAAEMHQEAGVLYRRAVQLVTRDFGVATWRAFWGLTVEGRDAAEVAAALGTSRNAVYLARARVLKRLRDEFRDLIDV